MLFLLLLLAQDADPFGQARRDIDVFCDREAKCVDYQRRELAAYVRIMAAFTDEGHANAKRCLVAGKSKVGVDWKVSADCMRKAVKGRRIGQ